MSTTLTGVRVSPVNMENRKELGIKPGDTVRVHQKIVDPKGKARIQVFEGTVLARKHGNEPGATFTVRKVSSGIGVEKIFPLYSPNIDKIEIVKRSKVRRAKLYYIREKVAREIKRQMRRMSLVSMASESEADAKAAAEAEATKQAEEEAKAAEEAAAAETADTPADENEAATAEEETTEEASTEEVVEEKKEEEKDDSATQPEDSSDSEEDMEKKS